MNFLPLRYRQIGLWSACLALVTSVALADQFVPPTEKLPPFRRDRLPLYEDAMQGLSHNLVSAIGGAPYETAEHRRTAAKTLALAIALDPKNEKALDQLSELAGGNKPDHVDQDRLGRSKRHVWGSLKWLSSPEAGKDGNSLASLLGETMANLYPTDSQASAFAGKSENPAWSGWIAETAVFKKAPEIAKKVEPAEVEEEKEVVSNEEPEKPKPTFKDGIILETAQASTVINLFDKEKLVWAPKVVSMEMSVNKDPRDDLGEQRWGFHVNLQANSDDYWQIQEDVAQPIKKLLEKEIGNLPERAEIRLRPNLGEDVSYSHRRNGSQITAAGFVLAHAALSGNQPDGTFIGEINREGKLGVPKFFWRSLYTLTDGPGGRLIVPAAAEPYFVNILALEKPEFFFKYEVLVASSVEEYLMLSSRNTSGTHEETYNKFKIIKDKLAGNDIGPYLTNRFVRERLQEIASQAPYHLSAKILNTYGTTARPRYLTKEVLAAEIWRRIDVINDITKIEDLYGISSSQLSKLNDHYERMRADLAALDRYTDSRTIELLREAKDLVSSLRAFGKAFEAKGEMWDKIGKIHQERSKMRKKNEELLKKLTELTGDPMPR
jgi:hypothetical protein